MTKQIDLSKYLDKIDNFFNTHSERLKQYKDLFKDYGKTHNISRLKDIDEQIKDSILPYFVLNDEGFCFDGLNVLDIGSGAGFAGLFLAMCNEKLKMNLCEMNAKKASFLMMIKIKLGLKNINIFPKNATLLNEKFDLITSRAMSKTYDIIKICENLSHQNTYFLLYKGSSVELESDFLSHKNIYKNGFRNYLFFSKKDYKG